IKIQGIHSGRDITAHIGGYSRTDHNVKILLLCPEQFSARCMGKRDVHRRKRIYSECFTGISHEKMDHRGYAAVRYPLLLRMIITVVVPPIRTAAARTVIQSTADVSSPV